MGKLRIGIPLLSIIVVFMVALSMLNATQYVRVTTRAIAGVELYHPNIAFIGNEKSVEIAHDLVLNASPAGSGRRSYQLRLGDWMPGTTISFTAAFAVANNMSLPVRMTCTVEGTGNTSTIITAHVRYDRTCNRTLSDIFGDRDTTGKELYNGTQPEGSRQPEDWDIGNVSSTWSQGEYIARNSSTYASEMLFQTSWNATDSIAYYDQTDDTGAAPADGSAASNFGVKEHTGDAANTWGSNYVWIETLIGIPENQAPDTAWAITIYFYFQLWSSVATF